MARGGARGRSGLGAGSEPGSEAVGPSVSEELAALAAAAAAAGAAGSPSTASSAPPPGDGPGAARWAWGGGGPGKVSLECAPGLAGGGEIWPGYFIHRRKLPARFLLGSRKAGLNGGLWPGSSPPHLTHTCSSSRSLTPAAAGGGGRRRPTGGLGAL